jgi:DNA-binding MarR family transcriptional regulator
MTRPKIVDPEALDLTLRALAVIDAPASAPEVSRVIREQFGATASTSRIYVAIGQLWERGHLTVSPVPVRRGSRHTRQTLVGITARGRAAVETLLDALDEEGRAERGRHARRERRG